VVPEPAVILSCIRAGIVLTTSRAVTPHLPHFPWHVVIRQDELSRLTPADGLRLFMSGPTERFLEMYLDSALQNHERGNAAPLADFVSSVTTSASVLTPYGHS
jgi:hypothetical protein